MPPAENEKNYIIPPRNCNMDLLRSELANQKPTIYDPKTYKPTFLILLVYCFMAIFSTVLSKPKKDFISRLADCSKQVQSSLSGCTWRVEGKQKRRQVHDRRNLINNSFKYSILHMPEEEPSPLVHTELQHSKS